MEIHEPDPPVRELLAANFQAWTDAVHECLLEADRRLPDALDRLRPYFANCRLLTTDNPPYHVRNDWTDIQIGVCTGPTAGWAALWPHLKHYG